MKKNIKIIANYLPQYHEIPENNKWWGKGFTDWIAVKNATPLYEGHRQPRIPYNFFYYDLSEVKNIKWQADLAKKKWNIWFWNLSLLVFFRYAIVAKACRIDFK